MKVSVTTVVSALKDSLEGDETIVLEIHQKGKHPVIFTITKDCIKGRIPHKNNFYKRTKHND